MSFPRYPKYKNSGVEWLGEVPVHWGVERLKRNVALLTEKTDRREHPVGLENIEGWTGRFIVTETEFQGEGVAFAKGDLLFGKLRPYLAKVYLAEMDGEAVGDFHVLRPKEGIHPRFAQYQLLCQQFIDQVDGSTFGSRMPRASWEFVGGFRLPLPTQQEQRLIAAFLDRETAKIDELVAEQHRLMELLKEKRQAVISHAVTKGLDPDAPVKPSGVEWLGEVPAHWEVGPVKRFFESYNNRRVPLSTEERSSRSGEFPYYGASGVIDHVDDFIFNQGLVLVSEDGANLINRSTPIAFVARGRYWVNNHAHILRPLDDNLEFWAERLESIDLIPFITGSAQPKLTSEALNNLQIAVPPSQEERRAIEKVFVNESATIDLLTGEAQRTICLLQERRSALISAAVTGQIDVRQLATAEAA